jgi:hypothetical protein
MTGLKWKDLPPAGRKAVQAYGLRGLPRDLRWGYAEVPLWWIVHEVQRRRPRQFPSDEEVVAALENCTPTYAWMKRTPDSIVAMILEGPPGGPYISSVVIEDGWHRFGWYLCRHSPDTMIPVIWGIHSS